MTICPENTCTAGNHGVGCQYYVQTNATRRDEVIFVTGGHMGAEVGRLNTLVMSLTARVEELEAALRECRELACYGHGLRALKKIAVVSSRALAKGVKS